MRTPRDLAAEPRRVAAAADAWVMECALTGPVRIAQRDGVDDGQISIDSVDGLEVFVAGTVFDLAALGARFGLPPAAAIPARAILEAYRRADDRCLDVVNGRCVLLIADRSKGRLLAVRDRMGLYPLFYAAAGARLLFSPSIEALLAQPEVSRALDRVVLAEHLMHRWVDPQETYFPAVRRVPAGHVLDVKDGQRSIRRYWNPRTDNPLSDEQALEQFDAVFERAVDRCMGRGRSAIFLSGGFDSVSVAAAATTLARRDARPDPYALSLGFHDPDCDEQFVQRSVAQSLGLSQELLSFDQVVNGRGVLVPALEIGATWPVPILNIWTPGYYALAKRAIPHGCDTILTGNGGDEWLNVSPLLAADLIRHGDFAELARFVGVLHRSFRLTTAQVLRTTLWSFGLRPLIGQTLDRMAPRLWQARRHRKMLRAKPSWIAPDPSLRKQMDERIDLLMFPTRPGKGGYYDRELQRSLNHPLVAMESEEHFEFGGRIGVKMLHPYLDPDLVELLYSVSPRALTKGGRTKSVVREATSRRFPALGFDRQRKVNATNLFRGLLQREGPAAWRTIGGTASLSELGIVKSSAFTPVVHDLFAGRRPEKNYLIWSMMNLESWVRPRTSRVSGMGV